MLKSELSLSFLQNPENMAATLKTAIHLYSKKHKGWKKTEEAENAWVDKMRAMASQTEADANKRKPDEATKITSLLEADTKPEAKEEAKKPQITTEQYKKYAFEKMAQRLLLYNS